MLQQAVVAGERVFELMDRPRQRYGSDDRPLQSGRLILIICRLLTATIILFYRTLRYQYRPVALWRWWGTTAAEEHASLLMGYYPPTRAKFGWMGERSPP